MAEPSAPPPEPNAQGADEHPEARGFGRRKRWRWELPLAIALLVSVLGLAVFGGRSLAQRAALHLPPELDEALGRPTWEGLQRTAQRCADPAAERYVEALAKPLLAALGDTPWRFQFMVVESPDVNAFALPGGYVVVNSALLAEAETGEEVAAVLAHELSHVTARHSTQRLAGRVGVMAALGLFLGIVDIGAPAYDLAYLANLGYDRGQEREADELGRGILMQAGISPIGMATFFERLSDQPQLPELISTHPDPGARAERARAAAREFQVRVELPPPVASACAASGK